MHSDENRQDMHSHLLPGLDDGAKDMNDSLSLIRQLRALGYTRLITTPHIMSGVWYNDADTILPALDAVRAEIEREGIGVELDAAAEYLLDDYFESLLEDKTPLLAINGKYVLVEFPFLALPVTYRSVFFNMKMAGYEPILAHPERYAYLHGQLDFYHELQENGVLLQVNLLSLHGYYGTRVQKMATQLVNAGLVQFTGTDAHHQRHLDKLCRPLPDTSVLKRPGAAAIKNESL